MPQGGGASTLLVGLPPSAPGTHTIRVLCVDAIGEEGTAQATYMVSIPTILEAVVRDVQDETPVVGACARLRFTVAFVTLEVRRCDAAAGPDADGAADGVIRWAQPPRRRAADRRVRAAAARADAFARLDRAVTVPPGETTRVDLWTYRCAGTCLWVQPRLGDGTEPAFPLWPLGVPGGLHRSRCRTSRRAPPRRRRSRRRSSSRTSRRVSPRTSPWLRTTSGARRSRWDASG